MEVVDYVHFYGAAMILGMFTGFILALFLALWQS